MDDSAVNGPNGGSSFQGPHLVDSHVHFYDCYDRATFFDSAARNFRAAAAARGLASEPTGCLLFTEGAGDHYFRRFRDEADRDTGGGWAFRRTAEDASLLAVKDGETTILLVAGRQVATREGLEVLALGCDKDFADGEDLQSTFEAVLESGALPVLPWGFGKWWLGRGALMSQFVGSLDPARVCLGDNSGRPRGFPVPKLFRLAQSRGIKVLPGSDPLPFPSEVTKPGSFGFVLDGILDPQRPAESLKQIVRQRATQQVPYGRLESLGRFCRNQVLMQIRKRA